jgi:hypothetical protein
MATEIAPETLTLSSIAKQFSDEEAAWLFLERVKRPNGPVYLVSGLGGVYEPCWIPLNM